MFGYLKNYRRAFKAAAADRDRLSRELTCLKAGYAKAIDAGLWPHPNTMLEQQKAIERGIGPVLLATLPKSGSVYVWNALYGTYGMPGGKIAVPHSMMDEIIVEEWLRLFSAGGMIAQHHLPATENNIRLLKKYGPRKIIVQIRDPRQGAVSYWHYIVKLGHADPDIPIEDREKFLWDHYLLPAREWFDGWLAVENTLDLMFSRQEDMAGNEYIHISRIAAFLDMPDKKIRLPAKGDKTHFRSGLKDEWREFFSADFQSRADDLLAPIDERFFGLDDARARV
ncbi:MAG: hypothetical protein GEU78_07845 [Actinobacteria bacterium]|nr:hypothetical protein [Actinomycetota bacterium]